jgi:hypothetical protein
MEAKKKIKIEKGIPLPADVNKEREYYPYREMKVGDSFFVEGVHSNDMCRKSYYFSVILKTRYTCKTVREGKKVGVRVWRLE